MTNEVRNVPDLRFPGFEGEWEESNIDNEFDFFNNKRKPIKENLRNKGEYPYYGATGIIDYVDDFIFDGNFILIGEDGANIVSRSAPLVYFATGKFWVNNHAHILYPKFGDIYFNYLLLENIDYEKYNTGTAQPKLNVQNLKKIKIKSPRDNSEQQKIGNFFSKLDRQIELEEQKLEKLEEQKKGYMQKIFSQELRFKDENGNTFEEWKNTNFNYFMSEPDNLEKGIDLRKDQLLTVKLEGNGISKANINRALKMGSTVYYKRFAGQFIYGKQNFFNGAFGIVPKFLNNYYSSGDVPALNIDYSKIDSKYFINYISRKDYYKKKEAFSTGTGSKRIHEKTLLDFDIMLPSVEEQEKIGDFFNELDELIEKQSNKIKLLKERKKGFLQKMFV